MSDIKPGWLTSEFRLAGLIGAVTAFGDHLNIFDITTFAENPQLVLIYRAVQLIVLGIVAAFYINGRSNIKKNGQAPAPLVLEERQPQPPRDPNVRR